MAALERLVQPLKTLAKLEQPAFDELIAASAGVAAGAKGPEAMRTAVLDGVDGADAMHQALVALFLEAAKANIAAEELVSALTAVMPAARARAIAEMLARGGNALRGAVDACSFGPPQIVDVSWQRSTVVASRHLAGSSGSLYTITLTTQQPDGSTSPLIFTATYEQLADLVGELKSAGRQVERERGS